MAEPKSIFEIDDKTEARAIAEAEADVVAGRCVAHEEVVKWLRSWCTPDELPAPAPETLKHQVVWTSSAIADVESIRRYIDNFNPLAARAMAVKIIEVGDTVADFPFRGGQVPDTELRETTLDYPYIIRYRINVPFERVVYQLGRDHSGDRVLILRVRHGPMPFEHGTSRSPG